MHPARVLYEDASKAIAETHNEKEQQSSFSSHRSLGLSKLFLSTVTSRTYQTTILASYAKEHESAASISEEANSGLESEQSCADESDSTASDGESASDTSSGFKQFNELNARCDSIDVDYDKESKQQLKNPDSKALNEFIKLLKAEDYTPMKSKNSYSSTLRSRVGMSGAIESSSSEIARSHSGEYSMFELLDVDDCWMAWDEGNQPQKKTLSEVIAQRINGHPRNDLIHITFGKVHFKCHSLILRYAKAFRNSAQKSYEYQVSKRLTANAFAIFQQFAMNIKPAIGAAHFLDVLQAADALDVPALRSYCMKLLDSTLYHEYNAFEIFKVAKQHCNVAMQRLMLQRIWKFFLPFVATKYFLDLDVNDVCCFLAADTVGVNSEIEIFYAAVLWLSAKSKKRSGKVLERVMSCVRYGLLPPWFTYSLKRGTGIAEVDSVLEAKCVIKMIEDGASIAATIGLYFVEPAKFESILQRLLPKVPKPRNWVYDRNCTYHYGAHEMVSEAVDFIVFKDYLKVLELQTQNYWRNFQEADENHLTKIFCQKFSDLAWSKVQF